MFSIFQNFYDNTLDLTACNVANIIMVPKVEVPQNTSDFRPISVINLIPKLISKVLSNRLRWRLPDLIFNRQTAFVHGRQIFENFITTRELLHHIAYAKEKAIFAKVDFRKAFDTLEWPFLMAVMTARGFPARWIGWVNSLWTTSSSRIIVNSKESAPFTHKRGLRQGDLLSPMLFNLAVDVFQMMIQVAVGILQRPLTQKVEESIIALQYADDTAVVARADISTLITFKLVLRLFSAVSGLQVNYSKSSFIPINIHETYMF